MEFFIFFKEEEEEMLERRMFGGEPAQSGEQYSIKLWMDRSSGVPIKDFV